jgi:Smg protein
LELLNIVTPTIRELIINRLLMMDTSEVEPQQVKWLALMLLLDDPQHETALSTLENWMRAEITERFH